MKKNENGFSGVEILIIFAIIGLLSASGWLVYNTQRNHQHTTQIQSIQDRPKITEIPKSNSATTTHPNTTPLERDTVQKDPPNDIHLIDYPKPTPPSNLKATHSGSGYKLTWDASIATGAIAKYQVFYQGNLIAEPTGVSFQHDLPPPPPSCNPISLVYYVKAVDSNGTVSDPSSSVTEKFGGC